MYVCICRAVTDEHIRREVRNGADSLQEVCQRLGVASGCGRCRDCAADIVDDALSSTCPKQSAAYSSAA
jgi:bacterioferritin-associated ferredoxin